MFFFFFFLKHGLHEDYDMNYPFFVLFIVSGSTNKTNYHARYFKTFMYMPYTPMYLDHFTRYFCCDTETALLFMFITYVRFRKVKVRNVTYWYFLNLLFLRPEKTYVVYFLFLG